MTTNFCFDKDIPNIENYELAKADNFKGWVIHHRLELETSDGEKRLKEISKRELIALDCYFFRPPNELVFMKKGEHVALHNTISKKGRVSPNKGVKMSEEQKKKISNAKKGRHFSKETCLHMNKAMVGSHWYTNGIKNVRSFECPEGYVPGRIL